MLKNFIKRTLFILFAKITKNLPNDFVFKKYLNHFFYYKKCQKIYNFNSQTYKNNYSFKDVFGNIGYLHINTDLSNNIATNIFNKIKKNTEFYFNAEGLFIRGCPFKNFPELKTLLINELDFFFKSILESNYKIYEVRVYRSTYSGKVETGSELPHTDSEPAPSLKCQYVISETNEDNAMSLIRWDQTIEILQKQFKIFLINKGDKLKDREKIRKLKVNIFKEILSEKKYRSYKPIPQKNGLLYFFNNNTLHWGGNLKEKNNERIVITFRVHCDHKDNLNNFFLESDKFTSREKHYFKIPKEFKIFQNY